MLKTKSIYVLFSLLMAVLLAVGGISSRAFAEDFEGWDASAATDAQPANVDGQNSGFTLETPVEAGAQPIPSQYVMPLYCMMVAGTTFPLPRSDQYDQPFRGDTMSKSTRLLAT